MKPQYISFVQQTLIPVVPQYKWWDTPRWWLVKLLGGANPLETVRVVRVPIDGKDFMERMWKQRRALVEQFRPEPTSILVGAEDFEELMGTHGISQQFTFDAEFGHGPRLYGLKVTVIPWMRGVLVMP